MESLISQGLQLALFGMGTVFVFLALLIVATKTMSRVVRKYYPDDSNLAIDPRSQPSQEELLAIISAAISEHKKRND